MAATATLKSPRLSVVAQSLKNRGFEAQVVADGREALEVIKTLVKPGAEVFTMSSQTLETTGIAAALNDKSYDSVRSRLMSMDSQTEGRAMGKLGAAPEVALGSVHALTEDGIALVASLTGSQLAAYAAGAATVILVVGSQKIVPDLGAAWKRLEVEVIPRESIRARKAYGLDDSFHSRANKVLLLQGESTPGRIHFILMETPAGF